MTIAKLTGQGLSLIAIAVALLWACLIAEKVTVRQAQANYARAMRDVQRLRSQQQRTPVSMPLPFRPRMARPLAG